MGHGKPAVVLAGPAGGEKEDAYFMRFLAVFIVLYLPAIHSSSNQESVSYIFGSEEIHFQINIDCRTNNNQIHHPDVSNASEPSLMYAFEYCFPHVI